MSEGTLTLQGPLSYYATGMKCPSPGCPHSLYRRSDNIDAVRCIADGPMGVVPVTGELAEDRIEEPS